MQQISKNKLDRNPLSKVVIEKLEQFENMKPKPKEEQQPKNPHRIWDEANDLKLLNALSKFYPHLKSSVWQQIARNRIPGNKTAEQCKFRYRK
jgi:Myb-like DNA-binding domain